MQQSDLTLDRIKGTLPRESVTISAGSFRMPARSVHPYVMARDASATHPGNSVTRPVVLRALSEFVEAEDATLTESGLLKACPRIAEFLDTYGDSAKVQYLYNLLKRRAPDFGFDIQPVHEHGKEHAYRLEDTLSERFRPYLQELGDKERASRLSALLLSGDAPAGLVCRDPDESLIQEAVEAMADIPCTAATLAAEAVTEAEKVQPDGQFHYTETKVEYVRTDDALSAAEEALGRGKEEQIADPSHYSMPFMTGLSCASFTEGMDSFTGNAFKYIWRAGSKGGWQKGAQDIDKAMQYMRMARESTLQYTYIDPYVAYLWKAAVVKPEVDDSKSASSEERLAELRWKALDIVVNGGRAPTLFTLTNSDGTGLGKWYKSDELRETLLSMRALIVGGGIACK